VSLVLEEKIAGAPPAAKKPWPCRPLEARLTPRENDVLLWLGKGKTNRDIADILGMSPRTVNKHLEHIFVKLGVETRSAAAVLASSLAAASVASSGSQLLQ
jgi:DNA-binding CsgD family transcriptional regulator